MKLIHCFLISLLILTGCNKTDSSVLYRFDLGSGIHGKEFISVSPERQYTGDNQYGFLTEAYFVCDIPEGNYDVKIRVEKTEGRGLTIKAESRRLMALNYQASENEEASIEFTTNVRYPEINDSTKVRLKSRELGHFNWG